MTGIRRLLLVRLSSLGDLIHTVPAFHSLRSSFPEARIDWLVERKMAFFLRAVEGIDEVLPVDTHGMRSHPLRADSWRRLWEPIRLIRKRNYDLVIDFQGLLKTAVICCFSGARTRVGFSRELVREPPAHVLYHRTLKKPALQHHVARLNLLLAQEAGAEPESHLRAKLNAPEEDVRAVEKLLIQEQLFGFIVINPGGGWPTKRWDPDRYGILAARITRDLKIPVAVVTGPGEEVMVQQMRDASPGIRMAHLRVPFLQLIPLFRRARLVIGGDTGPLHLACALETPVVSIMGPTLPGRNGPWSENDEVVARTLPCSYCNRRSCPASTECMDIAVEDVFSAVLRRLERAR